MKKLVAFLIMAGVTMTSLQAATSSYLSFLPRVNRNPAAVTVSVQMASAEKDYYLYYRVVGLRNFQVRQMKRDDSGNIYYRLATDNLAGKNMEYYIQEKRGAVTAVTPTFTILNAGQGEIPDIYFQETPLPDAEQPPADDPFLKYGGSFSANGRVYQQEPDGSKGLTANGNLRLYRNIVKGDAQFDFESNFAYSSQKSAETGHYNLTSMLFRFKRKEHQLEVGDLSINHSEYSTAYLNRRGLRYEMSGQKIYFSSFLTNSQQKSGFDGFGIPATDAALFGAVAGANFGQAFKLRGIFLTGRDNLESKTVVTSEDPYRSGTLYSFWSDVSLFNSALQLNAEYANSNYGSAQSDDKISKKRDHAYRGSLNFNRGILSAAVNYRWIGQNYNSIANLFMQNDRQGLDGTVTLTIKTFTVNAGYNDQKSYLHSLIQDPQRQKRVNTGMSWLIGSHFRVGGEFSLDSLDYDSSSGLPTSGTNMDTVNASGTFGYISGNNSFTLAITKTTSKKFTSNFSGQLSASLRFGQSVSLSPVFSYQKNEDLTTHQANSIYNLNLSGDITFVPQWFAFNCNGAYTRNKSDSYDSTAVSANASLILYLAKLFNNKIQPSLSAKSQYQSNKSGGVTTTNFGLWMQFDISF